MDNNNYNRNNRIMNKLIEVLKQLPEPYASQAIANTGKDILTYADHLDTPRKAVMGSFRWSETPEGHAYWEDFARELKKEENK